MNPTVAGILFFGIPMVWVAVASCLGWLVWKERKALLWSWREWRCRRARAYLLKYDTDYAFGASQDELVRRRDQFYAEGGRPNDPNCPDLWDVTGREPIIPLPHRTATLEARKGKVPS